jgi:hypothetical protein
MITNGGDHPAELWAQATAEHLLPIAPNMTGKRLRAAQALQNKVADAIEPHHQGVKDVEQKKLDADAAQIMVEPNAEEHIDDAVAAVLACFAGTEWSDKPNDPAYVAMVRTEVGVHFRTSQLIAKSWHADRNPTHPAAIAFKAQHHPSTTEGA